MSGPATCPRTVYNSTGYSSYRCGKPVKRNDLCGVHAAADERKARNREAENARWERDNQRAKDDKPIAEALSSLLGIPVRVAFRSGFVIDSDAIRDWYRRRSAAPSASPETGEPR